MSCAPIHLLTTKIHNFSQDFRKIIKQLYKTRCRSTERLNVPVQEDQRRINHW